MNDDALSEAVVGGNLELAELLVKNGAKVSDLDLPEVSERGDIEAVKFLLKHGVDIDTENSYGRTALHNAVDGGHLELVNEGSAIAQDRASGGAPNQERSKTMDDDQAQAIVTKGTVFRIVLRRWDEDRDESALGSEFTLQSQD